MVYEQLLTILFAGGIGAAIIVYAARPRQRSVPASLSDTRTVESFAPAPLKAATVTQTETASPVVETPAAPAMLSAPEVAPVVEVVAAPTETAPAAAVEVPATVSAPQTENTGTRPRRASRRKSTATKGTSRSSTRTKKS